MVYQDEEDLWHVCVEPDRNIDKRGQFYDILNSIEEMLEKDHGLNVMIVPVKPESATNAP